MGHRTSTYLRQNILGLVALFVALSASAYAAETAPKNSVVSRSIKDGQVKNAELAAGAVDASKVADNSLGGDQIGESSLDPAILQRRVGASCPAGQSIRAVDADGGVVCEVDDSGGSGGPPTGPAGGDLSGTYPDPLIAANAVGGSEVSDNSLTGNDINEASLGAVPSATNANTLGGVAASGYARATSEAYREVGTAGQPPFQNGWHNYDSATWSTAAFFKDGFGVVHLKGAIIGGSGVTAVYTLPAGYRPAKNLDMAVTTDADNELVIGPTGEIVPICGAADPCAVGMDGLTFRAGS